ncbi:MAG: hypothetical protein ABI263_09460 [Gelidibacter sp.]
MKIAFVATYPPRQCGIGTFTYSLAKAIKASGDTNNEVIIIAMTDDHETYIFPSEVKLIIH